MNDSRHEEEVQARIAGAAAEWFVEFNACEPQAETRSRFDAWLRRSPEHVRAYLELFPIWNDAALVSPTQATLPDELIRLARGDTENIIPLESGLSAPAPLSKTFSSHSSSRRRALAACLTLALAGLGAWGYAQRNTHTTDIGEQRLLTLEDGSNVEINARSKLKVRFTKAQRYVELVEGQALFRVAKQADRPFIVASGDAYVRAIGTQFDVYKRASGTTVTVIEGRVSLLTSSTNVDAAGSAASAPDPKSILDAGEQAIITARAVRRSARPDVDAAISWRQHRLVFSGTPISEVAAEFNRYNTRQIFVRNHSASAFEVSGAFSMSDLPSLLQFLRTQPNVVVEEDGPHVTITIGK